MFYPLWATLKRLYFPGHFGPEYYEDGTGNQTCHKQSIYYSNLNEKQARHDLLKLDGMSVYIFWTMGNVTWNLDIIKVETTNSSVISVVFIVQSLWSWDSWTNNNILVLLFLDNFVFAVGVNYARQFWPWTLPAW